MDNGWGVLITNQFVGSPSDKDEQIRKLGEKVNQKEGKY